MHIIFLVHEFPKGKKASHGAGNYVFNMARIMVMHKHKVSVITESDCDDYINWKDIDVYYIKATKGFKDTGKRMSTCKKVLKNFWRSYWYNKKVVEIDKLNRVDIVQSVNTYAIALLRNKKIPYITRMSSYPALWGDSQREEFNFERSLKTRRWDEELQLIAVKNTDNIIAPSYLISEIVEKRVKRNVRVIESPVFFNFEQHFELKENDLEEGKYFVTYGGLINRKSIQMLSSAIDIILDKYPDMKYVVIGKESLVEYKGDYVKSTEIFNELIVRNRKRFVYMGEISDRQRLFSIIKNSTICILPTRVDNLPNTVLESLALGKVIVSSTSKNGTSVEQLIIDGYNGYLAEVDNKESLLEKIDIAMNLAEEEKRKVEERARDRAGELTPEKVYQRMIKVYEEVINKNKRCNIR